MAYRGKILIIDDEPEILILVKSRINANGFEAITAGNGMRGLELAREQKPDVILLDLLMPEMDGFEVMSALKQDTATAGIPVILFTAAPPEEVSKKGDIVMDSVDFVIKPFDDKALMFLINRLMDLTDSND